MLEQIYSIMDGIFGIFFHFPLPEQLSMMFGVFTIAALVSGVIVLVTSRVVDQNLMKKHREAISKYQKKLKEAQSKKNLKKAGKIQRDMMSIQSEMMKMSFRPMIYTIIPILLIFTWMRNYSDLNQFIAQQGYLVTLPFTLPHFGEKLGWLGWYILCSLPASTLIKKIMNIEGP